MEPQSYNSLITRTFRDDAIRSVLMIDDDYFSYDHISQKIFSNSCDDLLKDERKLETTKKAIKLREFFSGKNFICDISNGIDNFNPDTARKSDLLILDYELEPNDPSSSLRILKRLSSTEHMNMVVIYTNESLNKVWLDTFATLKNNFEERLGELESDGGFSDFWDERTESSTEIPEAWKVASESDVAHYLLSGTCRSLRGKIARELDDEHKKYTASIAETIICHLLQERVHLKDGSVEFDNIRGSFGERKWLLVGNVFIAFHSKKADEKPEELWDTLEAALLDWKPNYFRLVASEIQNHVENDGLVFSNYLKEDYITQAAWLWYLLHKKVKDEKVRQFLRNEVESNIENTILNDKVVNFTKEILSTYAEFPECCFENQKNYVIDNISNSLEHDKTEKESVAIALNYSLAFKNAIPSYITNGVLLFNETEERWFLCVSPSCDTIPLQLNSRLSKELTPFRMLKFLELSINTDTKSSLENAHLGRCLFIPSEDKVLEVRNQVEIQYAIAHEHDTVERKDRDIFKLTFFKHQDGNINNTELEVKIVAQLKESYAARFQAIASSHVGRVGVDFVRFNFDLQN